MVAPRRTEVPGLATEAFWTETLRVGDQVRCEVTASDGLLHSVGATGSVQPTDVCLSADFGSTDARLRFRQLPNPLHLTSGDWTVDTWVWLDAAATSVQDLVWLQEDSNQSSSKVDWGLALTSSNEILWATGPSTDACAYWNTGEQMPIGAWVHLAATYEDLGGTAEKHLYLDGTEVGSCTASARNPNPGHSLFVGGMLDGRELQGSMAELRVSDTVRYSGSFTPELRLGHDDQTVVAWHFDEGAGTDVHPATGSYDLTRFMAPMITWDATSCP